MPRFHLSLALLATLSASALAQTFHGDYCTEDCSGHEAGYEWAEENGIDEPDDCDGNSQSFIEGCESYAEENGGSSWSEDDEDDDY